MLMSRYLAIDFGTKKCGLAVSDPTKTIASCHSIIYYKSKKQLFEQLEKLKNDLEIEKIIIGHPLSLSGQKSAQTKITEDFEKEIKDQLQIDTILFDERLSSKQADRFLKEINQKSDNDMLAAQIILQTYLNLEGKNS